MFTLYIRKGCPFCEKVEDEMAMLGIKPVLKNIADPAVAKELVARGGKQQVPYLVDDEASVEMYESADIVKYLNEVCKRQT